MASNTRTGHAGEPTKVVNLFECQCPDRPFASPTSCPKACPNINRYRNIVPSDQVSQID